jgi:hypothetical protein
VYVCIYDTHTLIYISRYIDVHVQIYIHILICRITDANVVAVHSPGRAGDASPRLRPPGHCAGAAALPPPPFLCRCRPAQAQMRVVVDEHCLPHNGECLRSTTYPDRRRCPFTLLIRSRCTRAGPAGPLRWGRCPAAPAVDLPLLLCSTAGGRRRALPTPRGGVSPFDHVPRLSSPSGFLLRLLYWGPCLRRLRPGRGHSRLLLCPPERRRGCDHLLPQGQHEISTDAALRTAARPGGRIG